MAPFGMISSDKLVDMGIWMGEEGEFVLVVSLNADH